MPKVSVLTPIYNTNIQYLREMIESVLNQTFKDFEFLILNDSPDNIELDRVVAEYQRMDSRIRYMKNETNLGISESRNKLLFASNGEYLAILDHDDVCKPTRFQTQVIFLKENPNIGVVGTWVGAIGKGKPLHFPIENIDIKRALLDECVISHSSSMIRKSVLINNHIKWEQEFSPAEDYMLWARLFAKTLFHNIPEELLIWRKYEKSAGAKSTVLMENNASLVKSCLQRNYPSFRINSEWLYLFCIFPLLKIKYRGTNDVRYLLFGKIPILKQLRR